MLYFYRVGSSRNNVKKEDFPSYTEALTILLCLYSVMAGVMLGIISAQKISIESITPYLTIFVGILAAISTFFGVVYSKGKERETKLEEYNIEQRKQTKILLTSAYTDANLYSFAITELYDAVYQHCKKRVHYNHILESAHFQKITHKGSYTDQFKYDFESSYQSMVDSKESWYSIRDKMLNLDAKLYQYNFVEYFGDTELYTAFMNEAKHLRNQCNKMVGIADSFTKEAYTIKKLYKNNKILLEEFDKAATSVYEHLYAIYQLEVNHNQESFIKLTSVTDAYRKSLKKHLSKSAEAE